MIKEQTDLTCTLTNYMSPSLAWLARHDFASAELYQDPTSIISLLFSLI